MVASNASTNTPQEFAAILRQRRRALDLTRTELARRVGCSPDTIKKLEEGERRPSKELAELLAEHLRIDAASRADFIMLARGRGHAAGDLYPTNLPAPLTSFVGRAGEVEQIDAILRSGGVRLLTLLGSPGVGKSRLALRAAARLRDNFPDGVWFVPLATVDEPEQLLLQIAKTLGIADDSYSTPLERLIMALRHRRLLLILDNFEQLLEAAPYITAILTACAQVAACITSRAPLEVYGEQRFTVQPLPVPPATEWHSPAALNEYTAVQLFVARVAAHNPAFQLTGENCAAIAELCARLDGIPLAVELAAGLTRAESPHLLLADVKREGRLALLTTTQRDRSARQQTLREAIAWSVRRLSVDDQRLFAHLGIFQGAFDLEAANAVAGEHEGISARLHALTASHLVQRQAYESTPRYRLLETLREYALETLHAAGQVESAQRRHAEHFAERLSTIDPAQAVGNLHAWRDEIRPDYTNLLAALNFALNARDVELTLKLVSGLGHFWYLEGNWQEGVRWLSQALALPGGTLTLRARANTELGVLYSALGRYADAELHLNQAHAEATEAGDLWVIAWTFAHLAQIALLHGQNAVMRAYTQERLQICRQLGNDRYLALTLEQIGCAAIEEGGYSRGLPWLEECFALWEAQGSPAGMAAARLIIGMAELAQGEGERARVRFQQAYEEFASIQHSHGLPWSLRNLGLAQLALCQVDQARLSLARSLERYATVSSSEGSTIVLVEATAGLAAQLGQHHQAAHLMGAAMVARQHAGLPLTENSRQIYACLLGPSIQALGEKAWEQARAVGATLPWSEAVASTRALLAPENNTL